MINFFKSFFFKKEEPKSEPILITGEVITKAIAITTNYAITEGNVYDIKFETYSNGNVSWYKFTRDDGHWCALHNRNFRLLHEFRTERINEIFNDE